MDKRRAPLRCKVAKGVLTIEIGVDTLKFAAERHDEFWQPETDKCALVVKSPVLFAKDVSREILREEEDGSTPLSMMLDKAIYEAADQGSEALDHEAMDAIEDAERRAVTDSGDEKQRRRRRQVVFNWLMNEPDFATKPDGYWGGREEVDSIDALLAALDSAPTSTYGLCSRCGKPLLHGHIGACSESDAGVAK